MKITKLEQQKRDKSRVNVYLDDEFWKGINSNTLVSCDLYVGKNLSSAELEKVLASNDYGLCLARAYNLISRRMQSEKELRIKLSKHSDYHSITKVLSRLKELDYVDDVKFAKFWVEARQKSKGKKAIETELLQKGINKDIIANSLLDLSLDIQIETARTLVAKKRIESIPIDKRFEKIGGFLARKGFDYQIIRQILEENKKSCN